LIIHQLGRGGRKDKRRKGNDGLPIHDDIPDVQRVDENEQIAAFLNGRQYQPQTIQNLALEKLSQQNPHL